MPELFQRILIANRGEIAVRIIRACRDLGIKTVAIYSEADTYALHTSLADQAVLLGPAPAAESYLNIDRVMSAARATGCQAIHPGYGFLSERAAFAQAVREAGLVLIGPSTEAIATMGTKTTARTLMEQAGVPIVPGYQGTGTFAEYQSAAMQIGYPLLVKATGGGGGKGMRIVERPEDLEHALAAARREAEKAFGDNRIYLERLLREPRHIEVQILADTHGNIVHLFERDCSIQRRHQKIIEETPAMHLDSELRARMGAAAVAAAHAVGYHGAGTVEFLLDSDGQFYFLEMNTRLQVEHPITELVVGVDLVKLQLRIAAGEPLPFVQADLRQHGHAIECRVYAEDAAADFVPSSGTLLRVVEPGGPGVRIDSGVRSGDMVTHHYDPLLAKLIVWGTNRDEALGTLRRVLDEYVLLGITSNLPFLRSIIDHPIFRAGQATTDFIERQLGTWIMPNSALDLALIAALMADLLIQAPALANPSGDGDPYNPWTSYTKEQYAGATLHAWEGGSAAPRRQAYAGSDTFLAAYERPFTPAAPPFRVTSANVAYARGKSDFAQPSAITPTVPSANVAYARGKAETVVHAEPDGDGYQVSVGEHRYRVHVGAVSDGMLTLEVDGRQVRAVIAADGQKRWVALAGETYLFEPAGEHSRQSHRSADDGSLVATMPGQVAALLVAPGDYVERGQTLVQIEVMKMEQSIVAPHAGRVSAVYVAVGTVVSKGQALIELE